MGMATGVHDIGGLATMLVLNHTDSQRIDENDVAKLVAALGGNLPGAGLQRDRPPPSQRRFSRPGSPAADEMVVLREVISVDGGAIVGEQRLAHVGGMRRSTSRRAT